MQADNTLPVEQRRNYKGVGDALTRCADWRRPLGDVCPVLLRRRLQAWAHSLSCTHTHMHTWAGPTLCAVTRPACMHVRTAGACRCFLGQAPGYLRVRMLFLLA